MNTILIIKANAPLTNLIQDISLISKDIAYQHQITIGELQFAKRCEYGYQFSLTKEPNTEILSEIVERVIEKYPSISQNTVVDILSELVNITVDEAISLMNKTSACDLTAEEKNFRAQSLLAISDASTYLPRYPWFMPLNQGAMLTWNAKDITSNTEVTIQKMKRGEFYEYEIVDSLY